MDNQTIVKNALSKNDAPTPSLQSMVENAAKDFKQVLPNNMKPERIVRIALTCIRTTPGLEKASPASFLGALMTAAQLGIEPIAGRAYILPFYNNRKKADGTWHKVMEAQFVLGYKGLVELFFRHEKAIQLDWSAVHKNDFFEYELGTESYLKHVPAKGDRGQILGYWVLATLTNGGKAFKYMTHQECIAHAQQHSKTFDKKSNDFYDNSPWKTSQEIMCLKTVLVQLCKLLPLSVELQRAVEADESSRDFRAGIGDALDMPSTTNWEGEKPTEKPEEAKSDSPQIDFGGPRPM